MAYFAVPTDWQGKTLQQVANEVQSQGGYVPRMDLIAGSLGISETTPLRAGMSANIPDDPGSGEYQFFKSHFVETTPEAQYAEQITKAAQEQINKETGWVNQYLTDNPFVFDEELAKKAATAEYQPYYTELLSDYMKDIESKKATVQDSQKLLEQMRALDTGQRSRAYQYAVENADQGYAGKGLFGSGMNVRDIGKQEIDYKTGTEAANAKYNYQNTAYNRTLGDYQTEEQRQQRDIGRAQDVAITGGIEQRRGEQLKPYLATYEQAYKRQFQPSQMSATDYLPSSYLQY